MDKTMDKKKTIDTLKDLAQLDIDAVEAYKQALDKIEDKEIHQQISSFKKDHEKHITALNQKITELGGEKVEKSQDLKGYLIEGFTALRSITGTEGALKAMRGNEKMTNEKYREAFEMDFDENVRELIRKHYSDEVRHLEYILATLKQM